MDDLGCSWLRFEVSPSSSSSDEKDTEFSASKTSPRSYKTSFRSQYWTGCQPWEDSVKGKTSNGWRMEKDAWGTREFFTQDLKRLLECCHRWDMFSIALYWAEISQQKKDQSPN